MNSNGFDLAASVGPDVSTLLTLTEYVVKIRPSSVIFTNYHTLMMCVPVAPFICLFSNYTASRKFQLVYDKHRFSRLNVFL
jgi:hypothetical protein